MQDQTPILLLTCPFTQLNTPYPATAYLKGFFNTRSIKSTQADLGIEVVLRIFSRDGFMDLFQKIEQQFSATTDLHIKRCLLLKDEYINTIDEVIHFLQNKNPTLAHVICKRDFLPEGKRFADIDDFHWSFGTMGIQDKAKYLCTLYLEDMADLIQTTIDPNFGFTRYAEKIARSANSFDAIYAQLQEPLSYTEAYLIELLHQYIQKVQPQLVAISIPFPGNVLASFRCGQYIKKNFPNIHVAFGGGFPNTELREVNDERVFEFVDFITLDDGELPLENIWRYINAQINTTDLKRTFLLENNTVQYYNNKQLKDYNQIDLGTPDYSDLLLNQYISAIEVINPMHSLWSDGRWNKLTMAHGCYWGKCTFCDISLDYIKIYEPLTAAILCDRIETIIQQTGNNGFHFVDEAAPPSLMKALAIEILKRNIKISWWTNIRFEKSFTRDLCLLLKASGCIAVSGGLEVASNRLLQLIQKGITVEQVALVNKNFTEAGIMVHAYLMYGFPTQTAQETIDSLEMVRQMFQTGILQSGYWHLFTMTAHSPVGLEPEKYKVKAVTHPIHFANNDVAHIDTTGTAHDLFSFGLKKSIFNYMHGLCLEDNVQKWFEPSDFSFKIPKTTIDKNFMLDIIRNETLQKYTPNTRFIFLGKLLHTEQFTQSKKGNTREMKVLHIATRKQNHSIQLALPYAEWLISILERASVTAPQPITLLDIEKDYTAQGWDDFELFWDNKPITQLYKMGFVGV